MQLRRAKPSLPAVVVGVSVLGLLVVSIFLYRWVNRLSELDQRHRQEDLDAALINLEGNFSGTVQEAVWSFRAIPGPGARTFPASYLEELCLRWKNSARWPQLISSISISAKGRDGQLGLLTVDVQTGNMRSSAWPDELKALLGLISRSDRDPALFAAFLPPNRNVFILEGEPVLVLPLSTTFAHDAPNRFFGVERLLPHRPNAASPSGYVQFFPDEKRPQAPRQHRARNLRVLTGARIEGWCFLRLNLGFIQTHSLPHLVGQYFGRPSLSTYRLAVVTGNPPRILYASNAGMTPQDFASFDAGVILLNPQRTIPVVFSSPPARFHRLAGLVQSFGELREHRQGGKQRGLPEWNQYTSQNPDAWQLVARDQFGSIAADVGRVRRRNLALGFGTLLLIAGSISALLIAARRAGALARRQMEFVAGISHEVRTPLTVIQSAAFNLAGGVVGDPQQVRRYGKAIQTEVSRLTDLVDHTLRFSRAQSGCQSYAFTSVNIQDVVDSALLECEPALTDRSWHVEKTLSPDLPCVWADGIVMKQVVKNLIENALKYAAEGKWLGIHARAVNIWRERRVLLTIEDHGPGIQPIDLPHVFEPFYRGQKVLASPVPGAGLGLSLVKRYVSAHGGRITLRTSRSRGTRITLHLPCA